MSPAFRRSHQRPAFLIPALATWMVLVTALASAGQGQEASIVGQVTDESGSVLPGVTVTATSPALQLPQVTDVTNERGEYRLTPLPIGTYAVQYELSGFGTLRREDLRLTAGFVARVDVQLKVGTFAETVTVSGAAPVVDVTSTTSRTQVTREALELIPTGRGGIQSVMVQAPGVRTNLDFGNPSGNPLFRVFGQDNESWTLIEGVATTSSNSNSDGSGNHFDYASIEESTVSTVGNSADSPTRGVQISTIFKSGGNEFHGSAFWAQSGKKFQSSNLDDALRARGITSGNPIQKRLDVSGDLGGRIILNKLWFYQSVRRREDNVQVLKAFLPDGSPVISPSLEAFTTTKVSYQLSTANKLVGFYQFYYRDLQGAVTQFVPWDSRQLLQWRNHTSKLEWQVAKGSRFLSLQMGEWIWHLDRFGVSNAVTTADQLTSFVTGMNFDANTTSFQGRKHARGSLSWYKPDLFYGNHDFKVGFDYSYANSDRKTFDRGAAGNYILILRSGVPFQLNALNYPVNPADRVVNLPMYAQDSWTIARRLTLNLGIRYAHDRGYLPRQCREAAPAPLDGLYPAQCFERIEFRTWNAITPRLHAAYDVTGDGKTVIKGGWGRFAHQRGSDEVNMANNNAILISTFRWNDRNANRLFDVGEVNFDKNGPDFVSTTVQSQIATPIQTGTPVAPAVPNPNEKEPMSDEFSVSLERELITDFAVRVTGIYSRILNTYRIQNNLRPYEVYNIPIRNADPGPDGRLGTGDEPGTFITYFDYPAAYAGAAFQQPMFINDSRSNANYKSFEVASSKRLSNGWMMGVSYSATKVNLPYSSNIGGTFTPLLATYDPNAEINSANRNWEWLSRASGAYTFPKDVLVSANFEHRSGAAWARTVFFTGGQQIPAISLNVEPIGTRRLPSINLLTLRGEKGFRFKQGHRLVLRLNVYNALNINTTLTLTQQSGPNFLRPVTIVPPRIAELNVQYNF